MKKFLLLIVITAITSGVFAQAPQKFNYQAVARDNAGEVLDDANLTVRVGILQNDALVWQEDHDVITNQQGIFSLQIGGPDAYNASGSAGTFEEINWGTGSYELSIDVNDGSGFVSMGENEILSVPYALHAANGPMGPQGEQGDPGPEGPRGDTPDHAWIGTELQFEKPDGSWGALVNLEGPQGPQGEQGNPGTGLVNRGSWVSGTTYNPGDYVFDRSTDDELVNSMWILEGDAYESTIHPYLDTPHWVEFQAPAGPQGIQGEPGETGPKGDKPAHFWRGTALQFENPDGSLGALVDLQGAQGDPGPEASDNQTLDLMGTDLTITGGNTVDLSPIQDGVQDADANPSNEIQDLQYSGGLISLSSDPTPTSINLTNEIATASGWVNSGAQINTGLDVGIGTSSLNNAHLAIQGDNISQEEALFEVRKADGEPVFAVYNEGVRVYVEEDAKGLKGGFAVGGYNSSLKGPGQVFFSVTKDSSRVYFDESAKGVKGGFAVGGFNSPTKGSSQLMSLEPDNYLIGHSAGISLTGLYNQFFGYEAGMAAGYVNHNVYLGYQAGKNNVDGQDNVLIGYQAGISSNTDRNVFIGYEAGKNSDGSGSVYIGNQAGANAVGGWSNVFIGQTAGLNNTGGVGTQGGRNVFVGNATGEGNITGGNNTYLGSYAAWRNTDGFNNVAIGTSAAAYNTTGSYNNYMGYRAGYTNSGNRNVVLGQEAGSAHTNYTVPSNYSNCVMMGYRAGFYQEGGSDNTYIGYGAGYDNVSGSGNVFIGKSAGQDELGSNKLYISNWYTSNPLIYGDFSSNYVEINNTLYATTVTETSDARFKNNIEPIEGALELVKRLTGVYFNWNNKNEVNKQFDEERQIGFIGQEVAAVVPELTKEDKRGYLSVSYSKMTPILLEAIKEQQNQIRRQEEENSALKQKLEQQEMIIQDLLRRMEDLESK